MSQPLHTPVSSQETVSETRTTGRDETMLDKVAVSAEPKLCLDDGTVLSLDTPLVFGRNPVALPEYPESQPHELIDETMKMSKVHAVVLADDGDVHVVDVGCAQWRHLRVRGDQVAHRAAPEDTGSSRHRGLPGWALFPGGVMIDTPHGRLTEPRVELRFGARSDRGMVRPNNEDSYITAPPCFVVADGMGGHAAVRPRRRLPSRISSP